MLYWHLNEVKEEASIAEDETYSHDLPGGTNEIGTNERLEMDVVATRRRVLGRGSRHLGPRKQDFWLVTNARAFTTIRRAALMGSGLRSRIGRGRADGGAVGKPRCRMRARQDGQALVEFALIAPLLLMLVFGIIYFGIGLNYWLDMNRVTNQGARQAAVNHWPTQCPRGETSCNTSTSATPCNTVMATNSKARLQDVLRCQTRNNATATLCFPGKTNTTATIGDPVKVKLTAPFTFFFMNKLSITLTGTATMRLEQVPTLFQASAGGPVCP
jgi:Flp pilus assembly protein TadG